MVIGFTPVGSLPLLVLSLIGTAMVSRAGVWFVAGPVHPYWIEKVKLSNNEAAFAELGFRLISPQTMLRGTEPQLSRPEALSTKPPQSCRKPSKHGFPFGYPRLPRTSTGTNPKPKLRTYAAGRNRPDIRCADLGFRSLRFTKSLGKPELQLNPLAWVWRYRTCSLATISGNPS